MARAGLAWSAASPGSAASATTITHTAIAPESRTLARKRASERTHLERSGARRLAALSWRAMRIVWLVAGWLAMGLGLAGVFLPLLPTTPFLLLAAACFVRSSPRLHARLLAHPRLGPFLEQWR